MNKRLQQFLAAENISQSQLADTLGVARASVSHIVAGRNKPGFDFIERLLTHYPDLNLEWLISGRGRMYRNDTKTVPEAPVGPIPPLPGEEDGTLFAGQTNPTKTDSPTPLSPQNYSIFDLDNNNQQSNNQKNISKIIIFYSDGSFQELP